MFKLLLELEQYLLQKRHWLKRINFIVYKSRKEAKHVRKWIISWAAAHREFMERTADKNFF